MDTKKNRRSFLKKIIPSTLGSALVAQTGMNLSAATPMETKPSSPILRIKPLGFQWETQDPFLFCVHHEDFFPKGNAQMGPQASLSGRNLGSDFHIKDGWRMYHGKTVPGFPGHPHRGFETITVVRKGWVDHSDSLGAAGRYGNGDVQWMTAGKGLQHAEMFPLLHQDKENTLELFQIWLNLPKASKFVEPHFKMLWHDTIPKINHKDSAGKSTLIEVIAGNIEGHTAPTPPPNSWAAIAEHQVAVWNIRMDAGASWQLPSASEGVNRTLYLYSGDLLHIGDQTLQGYHAADVRATEALMLKAGQENCHVLVLQGKPINEPVVQHGPFVMNTRAELQDAFEDFQKTQFGGWPWPRYDYVHDRQKRRFALYADGTVEEKA